MLSLPRSVVYIYEPFNVDCSAGATSYPFTHWFTHAEELDDQELLRKALHDTVTYRYLPPEKPQGGGFRAVRARTRQRLKNIRNRWQHRIPLVKDPLALLSAEFFVSHFDFDVICMIRHPLAFCGSLKKWSWPFPFEHFLEQPAAIERFFPDERGEIERFSRQSPDIVAQGILLWKLLHRVIALYRKEHPDWIYVRHEDLLVRPEDGFAAICRDLGMVFSGDIQRGIAASAKSAAPEANDPSFRIRDRAQVLHSWRERLDPGEANRILGETGELRKEFYPEDAEVSML